MKWVVFAVLMSAAANAAVQPIPSPVGEFVPMFRFWDGARHFYTLDQMEPDRRTFAEEGRPILVQRTAPDPSFVRIYRCLERPTGAHFVSRDPDCDGMRVEAPYGYVSGVPRAGYAPLFALYNRSINDQVVTTNYGEGGAHGYSLQRVLGFVPQM